MTYAQENSVLRFSHFHISLGTINWGLRLSAAGVVDLFPFRPERVLWRRHINLGFELKAGLHEPSGGRVGWARRRTGDFFNGGG